MPDTKDIVITLKLEGGQQNEDSSEPKVDVSSPESTKGDSEAKATYKAIGVQFARAATNELLGWAEYAWNKELTLNDDYIGQRNKRIAMQCINKTTSFATSIASGAAFGSAAGPIGAAVGALVAGTISAASTVRENLQAMDQQNIALRQMNAQLGYTRQRVGWSLEAASIGEDL